MKKQMVFLGLVGLLIVGATTPTPQKFRVDADDFDGAKFAERYSLDPQRDFEAVYSGSDMFIKLRPGVTLSDPTPVFEAPDTTNRDRLETLRTKLGSQDLSVSEINEYMRLKDGL